MHVPFNTAGRRYFNAHSVIMGEYLNEVKRATDAPIPGERFAIVHPAR